MKPSEQLTIARARIDTPEKWTQGTLIRDRGGSRCAMGAFLTIKAYGDGDQQSKELKEQVEAVEYLSSATPSSVGFSQEYDEWLRLKSMSAQVIMYNDAACRKHDEVMALFDRAIATAKAKEDWDDLVAAETAVVTTGTEEVVNEVAVTTGS